MSAQAQSEMVRVEVEGSEDGGDGESESELKRRRDAVLSLLSEWEMGRRSAVWRGRSSSTLSSIRRALCQNGTSARGGWWKRAVTLPDTD